MHALVTGGCGFIGSHLVDRLIADGHQVTVLDNLSTGLREQLTKGATLVEGDVADAALVQSLIAKVDAVFHLAAVASVEASSQDWLNSHRTNLTGTITIFDASARGGKVPVIYASSAAVYGNNPNLPLAEDAATNPLSSYGLDKLSTENYGAIAAAVHGVPNVALRFFNVYGPRQNSSSVYSGVISKFVANARAGEPLTFFGDGEQTRDFIYVGDIVELMIKAHTHAKGASIYNGCTGLTISLKNLAQAIGNAVNKPISTKHDPARQGDIRHSCGNPDRAQKHLGFHASTSLESGLAVLVAHDA